MNPLALVVICPFDTMQDFVAAVAELAPGYAATFTRFASYDENPAWDAAPDFAVLHGTNVPGATVDVWLAAKSGGHPGFVGVSIWTATDEPDATAWVVRKLGDLTVPVHLIPHRALD